MKNQKSESTPSIGNLGLTVDYLNNRVKILSGEVFQLVSSIREYLMSIISKNIEALELLSKENTRFTARIIGKGIGEIIPIKLNEGLIIYEEARIKTSFGLDIIYLGFNGRSRFNSLQLKQEIQLSKEASCCIASISEPSNVIFERLFSPTEKDVEQLLEMYRLCFTDYLVPFDRNLVVNAAKGAIFFIARNENGRIISSAIGESLRVGPLTFLEISEVAAHPLYRIKGAASGCARRVVSMGRETLYPPVVVFWEARMWRNVLGISNIVGLNNLGGILHQHCRIASPKEFTSIEQTIYGSLAVFYG